MYKVNQDLSHGSMPNTVEVTTWKQCIVEAKRWSSRIRERPCQASAGILHRNSGVRRRTRCQRFRLE
jgi:hypothetical protein